MVISLDSNIVVALLRGEASAAWISETLENLQVQGRFVISGPVYAELSAMPGRDWLVVERFLSDMHIQIDLEWPSALWLLAANRFAAYCSNRRQSGETGARRVLADFMIGAHAQLQAEALVTLDPSPFENYFAELLIYTP